MPTDAEINQLVTDHIGLARRLADRALGVDPDEAFSRAMAGLLEASRKFDHASGIPFIAFANNQIKWSIAGHRRRERAIKRGGQASIVSINAPITCESEAELGDMIADESISTSSHIVELTDQIALLPKLLARLKERDREVVRYRFGLGVDPLSMSEIADRFGITTPSVHKIVKKTLGLLAHRLKKRNRVRKTTKEYRLKIGRNWRQRNRERVLQLKREWRIKNPVAYKKMKDGWYARHRSEIRLLEKIKYQKNPEKYRAYVRQWAARNPEKYAEIAARSRAKRRLKARAEAKYQSANLTDSYVRNQLSKYSDKSTHEWTIAEVEEKRAKMVLARQKKANKAVLVYNAA